MRHPPFPLLLTVSAWSLAAALAHSTAMPLGLTLGVVPVMSAWHASGGPASPFGANLSEDITVLIVLAVMILPAVLIVAIGGVEHLKSRGHARSTGSGPHKKS